MRTTEEIEKSIELLGRALDSVDPKSPTESKFYNRLAALKWVLSEPDPEKDDTENSIFFA